MASNNPTYTASNAITDVEARLRNPNISASVYIPWISVAYQRVYQALVAVGQHAKEEYFGDSDTINLDTDSPNEYVLTDEIPRFGGIIDVEVKYGLSTDDWIRAAKIRFPNWKIHNNVSTSYRGKDTAVYYLIGKKIGFIPTPPESNAQAKIYYVKRPYQITDGTDEIDIPYRFLYPILTYIQARAVERAFEDYQTAKDLDRRFLGELEEIAQAAETEMFDENEGYSVDVASDDAINSNPFSY